MLEYLNGYANRENNGIYTIGNYETSVARKNLLEAVLMK
jgi:hypothetical protein